MHKNKEISYTQNRELSWLKFNERVLEEASDPQVPLLERLKFVSIFTSNLDEFFMVRVGSLHDIVSYGSTYRDSRSNMTAKQQLVKIYEVVKPLYTKKTIVYEQLKKELKNYDVHALNYNELAKSELKYIKEYYKTNIKPVISPQIVDSLHPFPHIESKELCIFALLKHKTNTLLGILPVPRHLPEVVFLPGNEVRFIRTEKIILEYFGEIFHKHEVLEKNCICITRNADLTANLEHFDPGVDFRELMKDVLVKRRKLAVVRLECNFEMSEKLQSIICHKFKIDASQIYISSCALKMGYVFNLPSKISVTQRKQLLYPDFKPVPTTSIDFNQSIIKQIKQKDKLLFYPFESMEGLVQLIKEAAYTPNVISIKITIYRLAKKAKIVDYLCTAAENGKEVSVVMELRARFDEKNNIDYSEKLEDAGCHIIYGFDHHKIHSKVCLITMKEKAGVGYITHVGTGNFNEKTSELYTDFSLLSAHEGIGLDAVELFKNTAIGNVGGDYKYLMVAPLKLKSPIIDLIDEEIKKGKDGVIMIKANSLTDKQIIDKFKEASMAGVQVKLIIRGICCILPNIINQTEQVQVMSVVGRFLEHSRVYAFGKGKEQKMYLSSADFMTRNTENRIEVAALVLDQQIKDQLNEILSIIWMDNVKGRVLQSDGTYIKKNDQAIHIDSQACFIEMYRNKVPPVVETNGIWKTIKKWFRAK